MPSEEITGISTEEFWARYAKKGAVGLVGGTLWIHRAICEAQHAGQGVNVNFGKSVYRVL